MSAPYNNVRSKLNRAIVAWLVAQGAGTYADTSPSNSNRENTYPNTNVHSTVGKPEVGLIGVYRVQVAVHVKGSARVPSTDPNQDSSRVAFDTRLANVSDALMTTISGDGEVDTLKETARGITNAGRAMAVAVDTSAPAVQFAANNADMVDFTCQAWYDAGFGEGDPQSEGCDWEEILLFEALVCGSNTD